MRRRRRLPLIWRIVFWVVLLLLAYQAWVFLHVWWWVDHNPDSSAFMKAQEKIIQSKDPDAEIQHRWVPYNKISSQLKRAVIAAL